MARGTDQTRSLDKPYQGEDELTISWRRKDYVDGSLREYESKRHSIYVKPINHRFVLFKGGNYVRSLRGHVSYFKSPFAAMLRADKLAQERGYMYGIERA